MKKISFNDIKNAGIVGGAASNVKKAVAAKGTEEKAAGIEAYRETTGENEVVIVGAGIAADRLSGAQKALIDKLGK